MSLPSRAGLAKAALPTTAIVVFTAVVIATIAVSGDTLGYDFLAYYKAARRVLEGGALYDLNYSTAGSFGLFLYPPTFLLVALPFGLLSQAAAIACWIGAMLAVSVLAIRLLPVPTTVRWAVLLLAGVSWPFALTIKLGQVTPILILLAVLGWRWLDRLTRLGAIAALGAAIKIQPALILVWAALTGRWRAVAAGGAVLAALAALATIAAGPGSWFDFVALIRQITDPVSTNHNVTPGTVARQLGLPVAEATVVQIAAIAFGLVSTALAARIATAPASYLVAVTTSQLVSPVLWDHYAVLLLLPTAYLLAERRWWALVIPVVTSLPLVPLAPPSVYPLTFAATLLATVLVGSQVRSREAPVLDPFPAP